MKLVESGDADALEELYRRYGARAYRVARAACRAQGQAQDAVQETFVSVWHGRAGYLPRRSTVAAWLLSRVRHRAIDISRQEAAHDTRRAGEHTIAVRPAPRFATGEQVSDGTDAPGLYALLDQLPDGQREVIVLAYCGELTHGEIAAELGLPSATVKGRMRLGLQKLRAELEPVIAKSRPRSGGAETGRNNGPTARAELGRVSTACRTPAPAAGRDQTPDQPPDRALG